MARPLCGRLGAGPSGATLAHRIVWTSHLRRQRTYGLLALLRLLGEPFLGIAVLNWLSQDVEASRSRPVVLANLVGFGAVAANDIWGVASGEVRDIAKMFLVVHLLFTFAFLAVARSMRRVHH